MDGFDGDDRDYGGGSSALGICSVHKTKCRLIRAKDGRTFFKCTAQGCKYFKFAGKGGWSPRRSSSSSGNGNGNSGKKRPSSSGGNGRSEDSEASRGNASVSLQLAGKGRVGASESRQFKSDIAKAFGSVPGSLFDEKEKEWSAPLESQEAILKKLQSLGVTASAIPREVLSALVRATAFAFPTTGRFELTAHKRPLILQPRADEELEEVTDFTSLPEGLMTSMFPFQMKGFTFGVQRHGRCMICDEMGLGKTIQAIAIAAYYRSDWPLLVISPSSVKLNWASEIKKWIPETPQHQINVINSGKDHVRSLVNVVSYDLVTKMAIEPGAFKIIIADESHYLKNPEAVRTRKVVPLLQAAKRAILLTGTPALSRPIEIYPQLVALGKPIFSSMNRFAKRYCAAFMGPFGWDYTGHSNLKELHTVLSETIMIRRLKADVMQELPRKRRQIVKIDADGSCLPELSKKMKQLEGQLGEGGEGEDRLAKMSADKRALMMEFYMDSAKAKVKPVLEYAEEVAKTGRKFLLFAHHQLILDAVEDSFSRSGVRYIRIDGSTAPKKREESVERFQTDDSVVAALLSLTAAGTGITLNSADLVVFAELFWTPGILMQAEDRAHRIGQQNSVDVRFLLANKTVDDIIWPLVEKKLMVLGKAMDGTGRRLDAVRAGENAKIEFEVVDNTQRAREKEKERGRQTRGPSPQFMAAAKSAAAATQTKQQRNLFDFFSRESGAHCPFAVSAQTPVASPLAASAPPPRIVSETVDDILCVDSDEDDGVSARSIKKPRTTMDDDLDDIAVLEDSRGFTVDLGDTSAAVVGDRTSAAAAAAEEEGGVNDEDTAALASGALWDPHEGEEECGDMAPLLPTVMPRSALDSPVRTPLRSPTTTAATATTATTAVMAADELSPPQQVRRSRAVPRGFIVRDDSPPPAPIPRARLPGLPSASTLATSATVSKFPSAGASPTKRRHDDWDDPDSDFDAPSFSVTMPSSSVSRQKLKCADAGDDDEEDDEPSFAILPVSQRVTPARGIAVHPQVPQNNASGDNVDGDCDALTFSLGKPPQLQLTGSTPLPPPLPSEPQQCADGPADESDDELPSFSLGKMPSLSKVSCGSGPALPKPQPAPQHATGSLGDAGDESEDDTPTFSLMPK